MELQNNNMNPYTIQAVDRCTEEVNEYNPVELSINFDDEYPINLSSCSVSVIKEKNINKILAQQYHSNKAQSIQLGQKSNQKDDEAETCVLISHKLNQTDQEPLIFIFVPFANIMCLGKKSATNIILMVKDKQKAIERDENGYQIVSDSDEEEFEDKQNELYSEIKLSIEKAKKAEGIKIFKSIVIDKKCSLNIQMPQTKFSNLAQESQTQVYNENGSVSRGVFLYKYLSEQLEKYEKQLSLKEKENFNGFSKNFTQLSGQFEHLAMPGTIEIMGEEAEEEQINRQNEDQGDEYYQTQDIGAEKLEEEDQDQIPGVLQLLNYENFTQM